MKTKEFIEKVKEMGFEVREYDIDIDVMNGNHDSICSVSTMFRFVLDTNWSSFEVIEEKTREGLYRLAVEYARTPLEEREEEKKYILRFLPKVTDHNNPHIAENLVTGRLVLDVSSKKHAMTAQNFRFTQKQIDSFDENFRKVAELCEKIEVTP